MSVIRHSLLILTLAIVATQATALTLTPKTSSSSPTSDPKEDKADKPKVQVGAINKSESEFKVFTPDDQLAENNKEKQLAEIKDLLSDAQALSQQYRFAEAKPLFDQALELANSSNDAGQVIWVQQRLIENLVANRDYFLANQAFQELVEFLHDKDLSYIANQEKVKWAKLKIKQKQFWHADQLLEQTYQYANAKKNRDLQLKSALVLVVSQLHQNKVDYATKLLAGAKKLANLPGALGRRGPERSQAIFEMTSVELKVFLYQFANLEQNQKRQLELANLFTKWKKQLEALSSPEDLQPLFSLAPLIEEALTIEQKVAAVQGDWDRYQVLQSRRDSQLQAKTLKKVAVQQDLLEDEYRQIVAELDDELQSIELQLEALNTDFAALYKEKQQTQWLVVVLLLMLFVALAHLILRKVRDRADANAPAQLEQARQRYQELLAQTAIERNTEGSSGDGLYAIKMKFNEVEKLNARLGIDTTDRILKMAIERIKNLNHSLEIMPLYGPYYLVFAKHFSLQQTKTLCQTLAAECLLTNKKLTAQFAIQECLNGQPFTELLTQLNQKVQ